ncbi:MAG TPA: lycopene cyclase domain-containing protein [Xanthomarina sp.]|nr:lycopene cyclase domain-containing protein [Xanthomarina sp.]
MSLYLWINILSVIGTLLFSFDKKVRFYTLWKTLFPAILIVGSIFITCSVYFTDIGVWGFNSSSLSGLLFFNLPIEECLFLLTIPFVFVFLYEVIKVYFPKFRPIHFSYYFSLLFTLTAVLLAIIYRDNQYTFVTLLTAGIINWIIYFGYTPRWYPYFIITFFILLLPLFFINGMLTVSMIYSPIIWYNESAIIGFRIFNIPMEQIFYNFSLFFSVVVVHEYLSYLWEQKTKST